MSNGLAYTVVTGAKPGKRIGIVKVGETGYYLADGYDYPPNTIAEVEKFVQELNAKLGVPRDVAESASYGSMFGWECPAAKLALNFFAASH
jgi:hypothetical protein